MKSSQPCPSCGKPVGIGQILLSTVPQLLKCKACGTRLTFGVWNWWEPVAAFIALMVTWLTVDIDYSAPTYWEAITPFVIWYFLIGVPLYCLAGMLAMSYGKLVRR